MKFWETRFPDYINENLYNELFNAILNLEVFPSMRLLWTAGPAVEANNISAYNCAYLEVDNIRAFDECLRILASGTGVGFSVETRCISKLPFVNDHFEHSGRIIQVKDSRDGWGDAIRKLIADLYLGREHTWDFSLVREKGARLKTMGGRASGPEPLKKLIENITKVFKGAAGRKLTDLECHDIMNYIGESIVVGGVRRSAEISLSDLSSVEMRDAKSGSWWINNPQRSLANNSAVYLNKPSVEVFMEEWLALVKSKSGERGIFNRLAARNRVKTYGRRNPDYDWGLNPCAEIILRPGQFCNLSTVVIRHNDTEEDLYRKVRLASILGTLQSTLTDFKNLRPLWKKNTEEERLLGVSLMGTQSNPLTCSARLGDPGLATLQKKLREVAVITNREVAATLGIPESAAVTAIKPDGNSSQLASNLSGIHGSTAGEYYLRSVRQSNSDPLTQFMLDCGIPNEPSIYDPQNTTVFFFPEKTTPGAPRAADLSALEQLEYWKSWAVNFTEHNPSVTIYVRDHEWLEVGSWVYQNFDICVGASFLPLDDHTYDQAVYQPLTKEQYEASVAKLPEKIDWNNLKFYETSDNTTGSKELACVSGSCEI
jgi:ribonucleoside-diphosphate reductase alpha chain